MTDFNRSTRQDEIWTELNEIRDTVDCGLLDPTDGEYTGDDLVALQAAWDATDGSDSPDRIDALVWLLTWLMLHHVPKKATSRQG